MKLGFSLAFLAMMITANAYAAGNAAEGEKTATTVCAACHGADGNAVITANPKLAGQFPAYLSKQLHDFKSGARVNAVMAGMAANLSDDDMANLAAYFGGKTMSPASATQNGKGSLGEKIFRGGIADSKVPACAACHGATGQGVPVQFPRLANQNAEYMVNQLKAFRDGSRSNDSAKMMETIAAKMSDVEIAAVADYIQGLK